MSQPLIVIGDKTSHGGTVITCSPNCDTMGKGWARVGDMVSCPRCKGVFPITQGDVGMTDDGRAVAYHGCKVACGATLISSQMLTFTEPSGGVGRGAAGDGALAKGFGHVGAATVAGYQDEVLDAERRRFRGRFQILDLGTGKPVVGELVRVRSTGGRDLTAMTDADGFTQWVEHDRNEALALHLAGQP